MGVPKHKRSKSRRDKTRMHIYLEQPTLTRCPKCGKPALPHTACPNCGYYKDREVVDVLAKLEKKERRRREKEMKAKEREEKKESKTTTHPSPSRKRAPKSLSWEKLSRK